MSTSAGRSALRLLSALGLAAAVWASVLGAPAQGSGVTTASVLKSTRTAIAKQISVHVSSKAESKSRKLSETIVADVGKTSGSEIVSTGKAELTVRVTPTYAYIKGNTSGLTTLFGLSAAQAQTVGKRWVSWKKGTSQYTNLKFDATMGSVDALLPTAKGTKLSTGVTGSATTYDLKWTTPASGSVPALSYALTISAGSPVLPVEETGTGSGGIKLATTLSRWGEQVGVQAPAPSATMASSKLTG